MNIINGRVLRVVGTEAYVRSKLLIRQCGYATDVNAWITKVGVDEFEYVPKSDETDLIAPKDSATESPSGAAATQQDVNQELTTKTAENAANIGGSKLLWKGFDNPDNIGYTANDTTRTYTVYAIDDTTVDFRCKGVEFSHANLDSKLSITLPAEKRPYFFYFNDSGQLSYEMLKTSDNVYKNNTLAQFLNLTTDDDINYYENITIQRLEDVRANEIENFASSKTKRIVGSDSTTSFTGTLNGSVVGYTDGEYFTNIDHQFFINAATTPIYPIFYLDGVDDDGNTAISRDIKVDGTPYMSDGAQLFYNLNTAGVFSKEPLGNAKFVMVHFGVGDSGLGRVVSLAGQASYANLSAAQSAIDSERSGLIINKEIFRITGIIATCIFKSSGGTGQLQYVDSDNNLFNYPAAGVISSGSPSTQTPNLATVLVQTPEGSANGNPIHDLPDALLPQDPMTKAQTEAGFVRNTGQLVDVDLNNKQLTNINRLGIGTATADEEIHVKVVNPEMKLEDTDSLKTAVSASTSYYGTDGRAGFIGFSGGDMFFATDDAGADVIWRLAGTQKMILAANGVLTLPDATVAEVEGGGAKAVVTNEVLGELKITIAGSSTVNVTSTNPLRDDNTFEVIGGIGSTDVLEKGAAAFGTIYSVYNQAQASTDLTVGSITNGLSFTAGLFGAELTIKAIGKTDITQLTVSS
jgi:hypothetical protein